MKGYSTFPKASALLEPHHQIVLCNIQELIGWGSYPRVKKQLMYSTAQLTEQYEMIGLVLWHINHCWSFNAK